MTEYIEREALLQTISETVLFTVRGGVKTPTQEMRGANKVIDRIKSAPAADVVEVVRCKDCRYWGGVIFGYVCRRFSGTTLRNETRENDFCSFGAKMDGKGVDNA